MKQANFNPDDGFTLLEVVVVVLIIGVLAAVLTPMVTKHVDEARVTRASQEAQTIADGILSFNKNTGKWPIFTSGVNIIVTTPIYQVLTGPGNYPACDSGTITCSASTWTPASTAIDTISNQLEFNQPGGAANGYTTVGKFGWLGPYARSIGSDPWGNAYVVNAGALAFGLNQAAFVLSAGPDGKIQTAFAQNIGSGSSAFVVGGDDIVARIK